MHEVWWGHGHRFEGCLGTGNCSIVDVLRGKLRQHGIYSVASVNVSQSFSICLESELEFRQHCWFLLKGTKFCCFFSVQLQISWQRWHRSALKFAWWYLSVPDRSSLLFGVVPPGITQIWNLSIPVWRVLCCANALVYCHVVLCWSGECLSAGDKEFSRRGYLGASKEENGSRSPRHSANGHNWSYGAEHEWTGRTKVTDIYQRFRMWNGFFLTVWKVWLMIYYYIVCIDNNCVYQH